MTSRSMLSGEGRRPEFTAGQVYTKTGLKKRKANPDPTSATSSGYSEYKAQRKRYDDKKSGARAAERMAK
jgi:hypothetical protein